MGQGSSCQLFVHMLKTMLKGRGIHVNKLQLEKFLLFVEEVCPWFPEEGTVSLETWKKVGKQLQTYYSLHGPNRVPVDAFSLWTLIRNCLDPEHEGHKIQTALQDSIEPEVAEPSAPLPEPLYAVPEGTACKAGGNDDVLSSDEQEELNEQAAQYHREDMPWEMMVSIQPPRGKRGKAFRAFRRTAGKFNSENCYSSKKGCTGRFPLQPACGSSISSLSSCWARPTSAFRRTARAYIYPCFFAW